MRPSVTFLGSGDAFSAGGRHQAGYLLEGAGTGCLLDCGATSLTALKRLGIDAARIDCVLISHLHGDHFCGLPFLFVEYSYETRHAKPLLIAGPPGTEERVLTLLRTTYRELAAKPLKFPLRFAELQPEVAADFGPLHVEPFRVPHQKNEISLGLRVALAGKIVLYSGDTGWTEELVARSVATDLFICECCFFETRSDTHLDYPRLAENLHRFGCKRMILTHVGREVLARRAQIEIELASDGLVVEL